MNRAKLGSVLFLGGLLFVLAAERNDAHADGAAPAPVAKTEMASDIKGEAVPANAGLKEIAAPEVGTTGACPDGMLEVEGDYCADVEQKCTRYIDPEGVFPRRCAEFAPTSKCIGKTTKKHFCIDKFEWPNKAGENPVVMKTWYEARDACAGAGKRLCGDSEWTLACEGQEKLPYPYGYDRNADACNIDKPHPDVNEKALGSNDPKVRDAEAKRLWQGEPSGSRASCVSPYGVMDMTGNVDEWVVNESGVPFKSGLKGGYWGPVRDRCRPETTVHGEGFSFYQIGFRCCSDLPSSPAAKTAPSGGSSPMPGNKSLPGTNPAPSSVIGS
jgi:hypothetical protein